MAGTMQAPSGQQVKVLRNCFSDSAISEFMSYTGRRDRTKFRNQVMNPLLEGGWLEMTIPDKPTSSQQKYRLTAAGRQLLAELDGTDSNSSFEPTEPHDDPEHCMERGSENVGIFPNRQ